MKKLRTFLQLSFRRKILLLFVFVLSIYAWFMFRYFNKYARFGHSKTQVNPTFNIQHLTFNIKNSPFPIVQDIRFAIAVVNKYVPWENVCRHQAYCAKILLNYYQIPYEIFVGFKKGAEGKIDAHAWTMADDIMVTGFCNPDEYLVQQVYS